MCPYVNATDYEAITVAPQQMASKIQSQPKPHIQDMLALQIKEQNTFAFDIYAARLVKCSRCLQVAMRERSLSISYEGPKFQKLPTQHLGASTRVV